MKKPVINPPERDCPECMGTGFVMVKHPTRPGVKIYLECKECLGKDSIFAAIRNDLVRIELTLRFPTFGELFAAVFAAAIAIASAPGVEAKRLRCHGILGEIAFR